jgi:hypothetical protein
MLKNLRIPEIVLGALLSSLLWTGIWGWTDSYAPTDRQRQECYDAAKVASRKTEECESLWERTTSDPVAFFTFVLSISTIGLWAVTVGLYFAGERQLKLARLEFISTHRPRLRIRRIIPVRPFLPDNRIAAVIEVANVGDSDATVTSSGVDVYLFGGHFDARPISYADLPPIPTGMQANLSVIGNKVFTEAEIDAIETGVAWLRVLGIVTYADANETKRGTSFARVYDRSLHRFVQVPHDDPESDREYED